MENKIDLLKSMNALQKRDYTLRRHWMLLPLPFLLLFFFISCTRKIQEIPCPVDVPPTFSSISENEAPLDRWWLSLGDANLNSLIATSLSSNLNLQMAWDRLKQARALAKKSGADLLPSLDGSVIVKRESVKNDGNGRVTDSTHSLGIAASYEIDLWGRVQAGKQAAELDLLAVGEELRTAAVSLTGDVAIAWYELLEQRQQNQLLVQQIDINEKYLQLIVSKFKNGQSGATDVLQQRQTLEATRGELIMARGNEKLLEHQLAILLGQTSENFSPPAGGVSVTLPPVPSPGIPAELIEQRPDIRMVHYQVQAADKRVAAALADRFPKVSLSADSESSSGSIRNLFDDWITNLAVNITAPIFDGGKRTAEVDRAQALADEALHKYGQTILTAIKEVEDALWAESRQQKYVESLNDQLALSSLAMEQTKERYINGDMEFLRFLTTILTHQNLQRSRIKAELDLIKYRISLYRALAGGWDMIASGPSPLDKTN